MTSAYTLHPIQPQECAWVVALHRAAFPPDEVARTIYGASHPERYLASLVAFPALQREHRLWGAWDGEELVGYVHLRVVEDALHLNYIAVSPTHQGRGVGRQLWDWWIDHARELGFQALSLDVREENERALLWYQRRGFEISRKTWMYEKTLGAPSEDLRDMTLLDWENAEAWQSCYGFSLFRLVCQDATWTIGRLGETYFRTSQQLPVSIEGALATMDPGRRLLIQSPVPLHGDDLLALGTSLRMGSHTERRPSHG